MAKRALRRHHLKRMKAKARRIGAITGGNFEKMVNHLAWCSGLCCGNRRRYEGPTVQERRVEHDWGRPLGREIW